MNLPFLAQSLTDTSVAWPTLEQLVEVLTLQDYNTRLVVLSTAALGLAAGIVGTFLLLRKRSLMGDALSHATLPGVVLAFIVMSVAGGTGKWLPGLLLGATVFGLLGVGAVLLIRNTTRIKDDAAMGIVLSVFFGAGIALLVIAQQMPTGNQAGLESFIYGKTASMIWSDFLLICGAAIASAIAGVLMFKEFRLLCFDEGYARSQGWPVRVLDMLMLALATGVTVIGLQSVGLILIIALLITPPAAARFWTNRMSLLAMLAAVIGAVSGWMGATVSALVPRMPAGAIIVIVASIIFILSMIFGSERGVLKRLVLEWRLNRQIAQQNLLRALYELQEMQVASAATDAGQHSVTLAELRRARAWPGREVARRLRWAQRAGLVTALGSGDFRLTARGQIEAARHVRNHRLWEMYLITHADIAPSHVDRDADMVEHVLGTEMVAKLERLMANEMPDSAVPDSPHALGT